MKKIIISGPILSRSGYGEMARFAFRSLMQKKDLIDLYLIGTNWGATGNVIDESEETNLIYDCLKKTQKFIAESNNQPAFDVSIQVTIPNEWKKMAAYNVGYTAGIETNLISPAWLEPSNLMNKIVVISEHAKNSFIQTIFNDREGNALKVSTSVEVCHFPVKKFDDLKLDIKFKHNFNYLAVCQWSPRKNLEQTIVNFIQEFKDEEVGLVLKINLANDSLIDKEFLENNLKKLLSNFPDRKCSINLIHGFMTDHELDALYKHPQIKAIVSSTHGEGFGFPLFEASYNELPVIATDWSGHLDFLSIDEKKMFAKVDYELHPIAKEHVWQGILEDGTSWAYPLQNSLKSKMREVYKDHGRFKSWAKKLAEHNNKKFTEQKIYDDFFYSLGLFSRPKVLEPKNIDGLSFCIPTHGKRLSKTLKTISSITKQKWNGLPYEIIIAGDVENFEGLPKEFCTLVSMKEEAHSKKVSMLRNAAAGLAKYENIVFCDDDIILNTDWLENTMEYCNKNGWEILGNKILNPDGTRHWDKATLIPRKLVDYNHPDNDKNLMQTSGFFMIKKDVFLNNKWDETKVVYADREGVGIPEDVQFNLDFRKKDVSLSFNKDAIVWHNDENYTEFQDQTVLLETVSKFLNIQQEPHYCKRYNNCNLQYEKTNV